MNFYCGDENWNAVLCNAQWLNIYFVNKLCDVQKKNAVYIFKCQKVYNNKVLRWWNANNAICWCCEQTNWWFLWDGVLIVHSLNEKRNYGWYALFRNNVKVLWIFYSASNAFLEEKLLSSMRFNNCFLINMVYFACFTWFRWGAFHGPIAVYAISTDARFSQLLNM